MGRRGPVPQWRMSGPCPGNPLLDRPRRGWDSALMNVKRYLVTGLAVLVVAAAVLVVWYLEAVPRVATAVAARGRAVDTVYATGVVEPVTWARVGPTTVGRIRAIEVREGETVKRGQELARLDDRVARARISELEARITFLRADVERLQPLAREGYTSRQSYERAESDLGQARAALTAARQSLDDLVMRAPLDGVVLRRDGEVGESVGPDQTLFWVGQPRPLRIEADVDEEDIPRVKLGQDVLIKGDAFPGRVLDGKVAEITPKGDPVSKSYRVRIALPDDTPLLIGMTTEANIVVGMIDDAVLVPLTAVSGDAVWTVVDGRARRVPVKLGVLGTDKVQIRAGVAPGTRVIVDPPEGLADGARVRTGS